MKTAISGRRDIGLTGSSRSRLLDVPLGRSLVGPAILLLVYLLVLLVVLPDGINRDFVLALAASLAAFVAVAFVVHRAARNAGSSEEASRASEEAAADRLHPADLVLVLVPMTAIVQYVLVNRDILSLGDAGFVLATTGVLACMLIVAIPWLLRRRVTPSIALMIGLGLTFVLFNMAALARTNAWHRSGDPLIQIGLFALILVAGLALYRGNRKGLYGLAAIYFVVSLAMMPLVDPRGTSHALASSVELEAGAEGQQVIADLALREPARRPDVFVLTYDAYVEDVTMRQYGIDNSEQERYLESRGFRLYPGTYSVAADSIGSMGRMFGGETPAKGAAGDGAMLDALGSAGYETHGVFPTDYFFRAEPPAYDASYPPPGRDFMALLLGIIEGEFRSNLVYEAPTRSDFLDAKRSRFASDSAEPMFLYTHTGPNHSQNSGACLPDETERFERRLETANAEMRVDIDTILEHRPDAIIVVNGDHGPYLTKTCWWLRAEDFGPAEITRLDIQDRFGTFLAIRWPGVDPEQTPDIDILQDTLPAVLTVLYPGLDYDALRIPPRLAENETAGIAGVGIDDGRIVGGPLDGEPLFPPGEPD